MEEFVEKDSFEFGNKLNEEENSFEYTNTSDFVQNENTTENLYDESVQNGEEMEQSYNASNLENTEENNGFNSSFGFEEDSSDSTTEIEAANEPSEFVEESNSDLYTSEYLDETDTDNIDDEFTQLYATENLDNVDLETNESVLNDNNEQESLNHTKKIDVEFLEEKPETFDSSMLDNFEYDIVSPTVEPIIEEKKVKKTNVISDTTSEELNKLTEYKEEKISVTDIKSLFNRVGSNIQEASDIFAKNSEMKEKIDAKFEELKQLKAKLETAKQTQYDEINNYKEEVFSKLNEKKQEVEERINKLKEFQLELEEEKNEFERYKQEKNAEIERVQKEVQDAYDERREELNHIEDVLRKQKDALDEERNQLSLDKIQYESDKNELANNLIKFNQLVDSFTVGVEDAVKED